MVANLLAALGAPRLSWKGAPEANAPTSSNVDASVLRKAHSMVTNPDQDENSDNRDPNGVEMKKQNTDFLRSSSMDTNIDSTEGGEDPDTPFSTGHTPRGDEDTSLSLHLGHERQPLPIGKAMLPHPGRPQRPQGMSEAGCYNKRFTAPPIVMSHEARCESPGLSPRFESPRSPRLARDVIFRSEGANKEKHVEEDDEPFLAEKRRPSYRASKSLDNLSTASSGQCVRSMRSDASVRSVKSIKSADSTSKKRAGRSLNTFMTQYGARRKSN